MYVERRKEGKRERKELIERREEEREDYGGELIYGLQGGVNS
jgi:hypothetical protein